MYRLYAIPPKYDTDFNLITRDEVYKNFCTLAECNDHLTELNKRIDTLNSTVTTLTTKTNNTLDDLVSKVYGGGSIGSDGPHHVAQ